MKSGGKDDANGNVYAESVNFIRYALSLMAVSAA